MPGNLVVINNSLEWYVGDSKIDEVIALLDKVGSREKPSDDGYGGFGNPVSEGNEA